MEKIFWWGVASVLLFEFGAVYSNSARGQDLFPEGQGRDTMFLACVQCHSLSRVSGAQMTAEDWEFTLYDMISRGAPVHKKDIKALKKYLIDNFSVEQQ